VNTGSTPSNPHNDTTHNNTIDNKHDWQQLDWQQLDRQNQFDCRFTGVARETEQR
jgi:hypothetical protein